jgi:phosphoadenosine phosphosulfate reductase
MTLKVKYTLDQLNELFTPLDYQERLKLLYQIFDEDEVLLTSSFGTTSVLLLHAVSQINPTQAVHFIDTTYHFPETQAYKQALATQLNLRVVDVFPDQQQNAITLAEQWWMTRKDDCCNVNKVEPMAPIKASHKVWISGLMGYQTGFRQGLRVFEKQDNLLKFHPLIDIQEGDFLYYQSKYHLPSHPLEALGYGSVGCTHCTIAGAGRSGRWSDSEKTECGLHPGFFEEKLQAKE